MRSIGIGGIALLLGLAVAQPAGAEVLLSILDGRVHLLVRDGSVREILREWGRVGGTTIVNGDLVPDARLTIELTDVAEPQALDLVLSGVRGYLATGRAGTLPHASQYDRITIMRGGAIPPRPANAPPQARITPAGAMDGGAPPQVRDLPPDPQQPMTAMGVVTGEASPVSEDVPFTSPEGAVPAAGPVEQETFQSRRALEVVDPRTFVVPAQPAAGGAVPNARRGASTLGPAAVPRRRSPGDV
jgi:hypothetical protein